MKKVSQVNEQEHVSSPIKFSLSQYKSIGLRVFRKMENDNLSLVAAGVAFFFLLAVFPLLAAIISLYGLVVDADELAKHINLLIGLVPAESRYLLEEQLSSINQQSNKELGIGFAISISLTLWSASKGADALIKACNITYNEKNTRSFISGIVQRLLVTIVMIFVIITSLILMTVLPSLLAFVFGDTFNKTGIKWLSWPILFVLFNVSLAALYRHAPHRNNAQWKWVTPGAITSTILWVVASIGFSFYVSKYASYNETYGSVGGIVVLLMWFYLSAFIVLWGAELNAALEKQTAADSTSGKPKPIGKRGAYMADNLPDNDSESEGASKE